jgi:hypothetical protein
MKQCHQNVQHQLTSICEYKNLIYSFRKLFTKLTISPVVDSCLAEFDNFKL